MSAVPRQQTRPVPTELETVVNWRLIGAASVTAVLLLVVPVSLALLLGPSTPPPAAPPAAPLALAPEVPRFVLPQRSYQPPQPTVVVVRSAARQEVPSAPAAPARPAAPKSRPVAPPVAVAVNAAPAVRPPQGFKRRDRARDYHLRDELRKAPEVDLESVKGTVVKLQKAVKGAQTNSAGRDGKTDAAPGPLAGPLLLARRPDLNGLPFRKGADCQTSETVAKTMGLISRKLRRGVTSMSPPPQGHEGSFEDFQGERSLLEQLKLSGWHKDGLSTVVQIVQPAGAPARRAAVKWLSDVRGPRAGAALANLAVFDLSAQVREAAVAALGKRPRSEYRAALLRALRYPWPPAADHAAEALVQLRDISAVPALAALLDRPDPAAPVKNRDEKWVVSELVRVNHLRNCFLCHAPSVDAKDHVRGIVPTPGQRLPRVYYESREGVFVRADVTYLRQDFSLMQRVDQPGEWPDWQRFDFLVRTRALTAAEVAALDQGRAAPRPVTYPQRQAVLFALRELTGEDRGHRSEDWMHFLASTWLEHEL